MIERILATFDAKAPSFSDSSRATGDRITEEDLKAVIGMCSKKNALGFSLLLAKYSKDKEELKKAIAKELPGKIPHIFICSMTGEGLIELKDLLWKTLNP